MSGIAPPPSVNYPSPLIAVPTKWDNPPPEGEKIIPCEVDWGSMGGANLCVAFNLQNNAPLNFSQITALSVDNSQCGADVTFIFPDTTQTLSVPAYTPKLIIPVFTNQTQFWLYAPNAQSEDITRFAIHNSQPPPIAVPTTQEQNTAVFNNITTQVSAPGTLQIVPAGVNGTVENIFATLNSASGGLIFTLKDGNGNVLAGAQGNYGSLFTGTLLDLQNIRVRFQNGIQFVSTLATVAAGGAVSLNLYYRTP